MYYVITHTPGNPNDITGANRCDTIEEAENFAAFMRRICDDVVYIKEV